MVSKMTLIMKLSLVIFIAVCILPSAFAGGLLCQTCPEDPLQSPEQCNMSSSKKNCSTNRCIALTAELTNGTRVGMRGCASSSAGDCETATCNEGNKTLSGSFTRCVAECCSTPSRCNANLFPMLPTPSSTVPGTVVSSTAVPNTTQPATQPGTPPPTTSGATVHSAGIKMKTLLHLLMFWLYSS